jgi:Type IX secretion system protein PorV
MKQIRILILLVTGVILIPLRAENPNLGTSGAQFLKIPVSARAAAMGGAYVGICQDATAVFWNPAGILGVKTNSMHFSYSKWFDTFNVNAAAYVYNAGNFGTIAISALMLSVDKMEITTEFNPNGTGQFFDAQDLAFGLSYARNLTDQFRVGLTARYINQRIWNETAAGIAFDIGTQYFISFRNFTLAMSMSNFGQDMKFDGPDLSVNYDANSSFPNRLTSTRLETESYPLPLNFEFGIAIDMFNTTFSRGILAIDAVHPNDNRERINFGTEISFYNRLFLRGGYRLNHDDEQYNLGLGFIATIGLIQLNIDYAYSLYNILPDVNRISFGANF